MKILFAGHFFSARKNGRIATSRRICHFSSRYGRRRALINDDATTMRAIRPGRRAFSMPTIHFAYIRFSASLMATRHDDGSPPSRPPPGLLRACCSRNTTAWRAPMPARRMIFTPEKHRNMAMMPTEAERLFADILITLSGLRHATIPNKWPCRRRQLSRRRDATQQAALAIKKPESRCARTQQIEMSGRAITTRSRYFAGAVDAALAGLASRKRPHDVKSSMEADSSIACTVLRLILCRETIYDRESRHHFAGHSIVALARHGPKIITRHAKPPR